ncbi:hypothetical protein Tco_0825195, partial [Tanacetum coccineum]
LHVPFGHGERNEIIMISSDSSSDLESINGPSSFNTRSIDDILCSSPDIEVKRLKLLVISFKGKPSLSSVSKAKASGSSSSKAKASGSSPQTLIVKSPVPIKNCVLRFANGKTWDAILNKTFGVKIPTTGTGAKQKKWKRNIRGGS